MAEEASRVLIDFLKPSTAQLFNTLDVGQMFDVEGINAVNPITLETKYGLDVTVDFETGEEIHRFRADVKLTNGWHHVCLEICY